MIDENLNASLIEVNHAPSFATDASLDYRIKWGLLHDSFQLLNLSKQWKQKYISDRQSAAQDWILKGKQTRLSQEEKEDLKREFNFLRHE